MAFTKNEVELLNEKFIIEQEKIEKSKGKLTKFDGLETGASISELFETKPKTFIVYNIFDKNGVLLFAEIGDEEDLEALLRRLLYSSY